MSRTLTLISSRPILFTSVLTFLLTRSRNFSRSWLISSIESVAMTRRIWPTMMSRACPATSLSCRPSRRSAALFMMSGEVEMPMVNVEGTLTRMFFLESALVRSISIVIGSRLR